MIWFTCKAESWLSLYFWLKFSEIIIVRVQLVQLLRGQMTKNFKPEKTGPNCNGKGRASPVITLFSILLYWIRTSKELQLFMLIGLFMMPSV
jgi:hypothetical protein